VQCGAGFLVNKGEWHVTYPVYNKPGLHFCSHKCIADYEWIPAEFPLHHGLPCRAAKQGANGEWENNLILVGKLKLGKYDSFICQHDSVTYSVKYFKHCQVRRDSVEGK